MSQDIILAVDYHDQQCVIRRWDCVTDKQSILKVPTIADDLLQTAEAALKVTRPRDGKVVWIQESTTGWVRVKRLLGERVEFILANVLQMPKSAKAHCRKTDKVDTGRILREYRNGELPKSFQPDTRLREVRRITALRENLVARRTALRNWINRYLAHETWADRENLWSPPGLERLRNLTFPESDRFVIDLKVEELELIAEQMEKVERRILEIYLEWPEARRVDAIKGIGPVAAVSLMAQIGPIDRFENAEKLIGFAGLAPGVRQSDETRHDGRIGGGGTDKHLRHYIIEATVWARNLPRYRPTYERVSERRGNKIGRLVVGRMLLRSIYKMLHDGVEFDPQGTLRN
jgi:transposase